MERSKRIVFLCFTILSLLPGFAHATKNEDNAANSNFSWEPVMEAIIQVESGGNRFARSGKSVGVNDFILSLMFQNTPAELKFLMVDPKQVELEMYSGLPYLLAPIVFESGKAIKLLQWAVEEMERRYTVKIKWMFR